ncbi:MAG: hypothetical protein ACHQ49_10480 [Elusimicrobiota bacterium]
MPRYENKNDVNGLSHGRRCFLAGACGGLKEAKDVPFRGTWTISEENGINHALDAQFTSEVTADKGRFRIVKTTEIRNAFGVVKEEDVSIFDGDLLSQSAKMWRENVEGASDLEMPQQPPQAPQKPSPAALRAARFWVHDEWLVGLPKKGPGGQVAGRETVYYEGKKTRPDGEITLRVWADSESGMILKSISMIYSSQVNAMVMRVTQECRKIEFAPVDAAVFAEPKS